MKKSFILILLIFIVGIFFAACVRDSVTYCPYCSSSNISKDDNGVYKCDRCGKSFGAKEITQ